MKFIHRLIPLGIVMLCATATAGESPSAWSSFRNGGASTVAGSLPTDWSPDNGIQWQTETDGYGQSAPVIFDGKVLITAVVGDMKDECALTCYDLESGQQQWQYQMAATAKGPSTYMYSRGAPTPMVDSAAVYAFFEGGDLLAVGHDGQKLWHQDLSSVCGPLESNHGLAASPAQTDDLVIVNIEHRGPSFLLAFSKADGTLKWKTERPSGSSWSSPVVVNGPDSDYVVVSSAGSLAIYNADTGEQQWMLDGLEGNSLPSPCASGERIITGARIPEFGSARDAAPSNLCITPGSSEEPYEIAWRASKAVCDYASPIVDGDQVYFLNKVGVLSCLDSRSGESVYQKRLRSVCWATPVVADNGIYFFGKDGVTRVIERGRNFNLIASSRLWDEDQAPAPEKYREHSGGGGGHHHGGGGHGKGGHGNGEPGKASDEKGDPAKGAHGNADHGKGNHGKGDHGAGRHGGRGSRGGGMMAALMKNDANGDGTLQAEELPEQFRGMLARVDTNGDGALDAAELKSMQEQFRKRRANSRESSRDPIVYGVAAVNDWIVIRTGTRLYAVSSSTRQDATAEVSP